MGSIYVSNSKSKRTVSAPPPREHRRTRPAIESPRSSHGINLVGECFRLPRDKCRLKQRRLASPVAPNSTAVTHEWRTSYDGAIGEPGDGQSDCSDRTLQTATRASDGEHA